MDAGKSRVTFQGEQMSDETQPSEFVDQDAPPPSKPADRRWEKKLIWRRKIDEKNYLVAASDADHWANGTANELSSLLIIY